MTITRSCWLILLLLCIMPRPVHAHSLDHPQAKTLLDQHQSGVYRLDAAQLATPEQTHLDVRVAMINGDAVPYGVRMVAIATTNDDRNYLEQMHREGDVFGASLPIGTDWDVLLSIYGDVGESTVELTITSYRETALIIRIFTFLIPALLMGGILFAYKRSGLTLST